MASSSSLTEHVLHILELLSLAHFFTQGQESSMAPDAHSTRAESSARNPSPAAGLFPSYLPHNIPHHSAPKPLLGLGWSPHQPL